MQLLKIMVLEDEAFQRMAAVNLLKAVTEQTIFEAESGEQALVLIDQESAPFDVIFCDLQLEGMDGIEFIRHVAERNLSRSIVLASAMEEDVVASVAKMTQAYGIKLLGIIKKPFPKTELEQLFDEYRLYIDSAKRGSEKRFSAIEQKPLDAIKKALINSEFEPWFQPKISTENKQLVSVEALARWPLADGSVVSPAAFIPVIEKSGLIDDLTMIILEKAIKQGKEWHDAGYPIIVAVNLSPTSLSDENLPNAVFQMIEKYNYDCSLLTLEITESAITDNIARLLGNLSRFRLKGIKLSIDDFGTGYSSLQQLSSAPFTELKLDQSFIKGIDQSPKNLLIVKSTIELAKDLQLKTVAEGVEEESEWEIIKELGCNLVQGYFFSKPLKGNELIPWALKNNHI
jgi:EAL domain-containing protein (putative c-di-GMP-specific phosphodiesterase class I)